MELSSPKLKNIIIFQEEFPKPENQTKKLALKTFLVFLLHKIKNLLLRIMKVVFLLHNIKNG